ncbi:MAG TPA: hypothetical protein VGH72_33810 [Pseudonocardia sp.]|jgi:hypothetical protein
MSEHSAGPTQQQRRQTWRDRFHIQVPTYWVGAVIALVLALLFVASLWFVSLASQTQDHADSSDARVTAVQSQAAPLAGQVQSVCDQGGVAATQLNAAGACTQASKVQSAIEIPGPSGPAGPSGANGSNGQPGRGIASTHLFNGDLIVVYTDGTSADVGTVTGPQGIKGADGKDGRGITGSAIVGTDLVVTYSDGTSSDLGNVVGPAGATGAAGANGANGANGTDGSNGVSVSSVVLNSAGHMIVTYSDGTTSDAGPVPQAQVCPNGSAPSTTNITEPSGLATTQVNGVLVCGG